MGYLDPPDDDYEACHICGQNVEGECICPVCPVCEDVGWPDCYVDHGLRRTEEQNFLLESSFREVELLSFLENQYWRGYDDYKSPTDNSIFY